MFIDLIAGARPNFMKIAPIIKAINERESEEHIISFRLVHTGQHFDKNMSDSFFEELGLPEPDVNLGAGGGTQAEQTAKIMIGYEQLLMSAPSDLCLVVGDVPSTMACAITTKKMCIPCVHVEAGIRSGDMTMPEEINRIVTDSICDEFFTTTTLANAFLTSQKIPAHRIHFVGNTMIDTLMQNLGKLKKPSFWDDLQLKAQHYFILTLHRPSNVDDPIKLKEILLSIGYMLKDYFIIFPAHPRTKTILDGLGIEISNLILVEPQSYLEFIYLVNSSKGIITDSGGITEEATVLNIPCITMRETTERPETITYGTNVLVGNDLSNLQKKVIDIIDGNWKTATIPERWDGRSAERIVDIMISKYY